MFPYTCMLNQGLRIDYFTSCVNNKIIFVEIFWEIFTFTVAYLFLMEVRGRYDEAAAAGCCPLTRPSRS